MTRQAFSILSWPVVLIAASALLPLAWADDWPAEQPVSIFSDSGKFFVRIVPGTNLGGTVGFAGAQKGAPASGWLYRLQPDKSYALVKEIALANPIAPVDVLVSNTGAFLTFDNWHNLGYGKTVAIYGDDGRLVRSYELEGLYPADKLSKISASVSSRHWRCRPWGFVDPKEQARVYVGEALGGLFIFDLGSGQVRYEPGARQECHPPRGPLSSTRHGQ